METGTKILLERMKDCPDEFLDSNRYGVKWSTMLVEAYNCLPQEEVDALKAGLSRLRIDRFNENVLRTLTGEATLPPVWESAALGVTNGGTGQWPQNATPSQQYQNSAKQGGLLSSLRGSSIF